MRKILLLLFVLSAATSFSQPGDIASMPPFDPADENPVGDGSFEPNIEEVRGVVAEFDFANGVLNLEGTLMPLADDAVFFDEFGDSLTPEDLVEGDHLVVRSLWTSDLLPIVIEVVRNGEPPPHASSQWVQFQGLVELEDGTQALVAAGKELLLAFDAPVFVGGARAEISQEDIAVGDEVAIKIRFDDFGTAAVEVHIDPPPSAVKDPGDFPGEPFWDQVDRIYDFDPEFRQLRFELEAKLINEDTQFFDAFGLEITADDLFVDDRLVVLFHNPTLTALRVDIQDPEGVYELPDDPEIGLYFASFARFDEDDKGRQLLIMYDPYWKPLAVDAPIFDDEAEREISIEVEELVGQFVRARIRHQQPGEEGPGDLIVELAINPSDRPLAPGERPEPSEIFGEWNDLGVLAVVDLENSEIIRAGITIVINGDTEIFDDESGARLFADELEPGDHILVDALATSDPSTVLARQVRLNPIFPDEGFEPPLFSTNVLAVDGERILTEGGRWFVDEATVLRDDASGEELALADFVEGDLINIRIQHTNVGDIVLALERNPRIEQPFDRQWEGDWEIFSIDRETGAVRFAGPPIGFISRTQVRDRDGREIGLEDIPLGESIVINQAPSATGGPALARSVEIQNFETFYDGPNFFFTQFVGIEGDLILTADFPRYLAADAEISSGDGTLANINTLERGTRVRATINHPLAGLNSPFGDVITRLVVNPQFGDDGFNTRPVETGDISGLVIEIDLAAGTLELEATVIRVDFRTEVIDNTTRADLSLAALLDLGGELVAVNFFQAPDGLRATKITVLDPLRVPTPRPDLIVAPLQDVDPDEGLIFLRGLVAAVTDEDTEEIRLADGSLGALEDIAVGDEVRLQIIEGDDGAVAARIKVSGGFTGPIFGGGGLEIVSTFPEPGEAFVPLRLEIEVTFNEEVRGLLVDEDFDIGLFPPLDFDLDLSRDGRTIIITPVGGLEDDTVYQLFVESGRFGRFTLHFTTGDELPQGGIIGRIEARDIPFELIAQEESGVFLLDAAILGDFFAAAQEGEVIDEEAEAALFDAAFVAATAFDRNGVYRFETIPDGEFFVFATVVLEFGPGEQLELEAFYDGDGDGEFDAVIVSGALVDRIDLTVVPPEPLFVEDTFPADGDVLIDAEASIEIAFSEPLRTDFSGLLALDAVLFPKPLSGQLEREDLSLSEDGFVVSFDVELAEDTNYSLLIFNAENEAGLGLEEPVVVHFSTGEGGGDSVSGRLALPAKLPPERVIKRPALLALIPFRDFDALNPDVENFAIAGALSFDGFYEFEGVPPGRYAVLATVNVDLPSFFRLASRGLQEDFAAFEQEGRFGADAPPDFVGISFVGFSQDSTGEVRDDVRDGSEDVDLFLRPENVRRSALRAAVVDPSPEDLQQAPELLDIAVEFSEPLVVQRNFIEMEAFMRPLPLSGSIMENFDIENGGQRIIFRDVELEPSTAYKFSIAFARGISGQELAEPFNLVVSTAGAEELVFGTVSGEVVLQGDEISEAAVLLYDPEGDDLDILAGVLVDDDGSFQIDDVVAGEYAAYVEIETVGGRDLLLSYDADGDGEPDVFLVDDGIIAGIDFVFVVADEEEIPAGEPAQLTLDVELDFTDEVAVDAFKDDFVAELAAALGIDPARIVIVGLAAGSVQVTFVIAESEDASEPAASEALQTLSTLVNGNLGDLGAVVSAQTEEGAVELPVRESPNANAVVSLDLDAADGNQTSLQREVEAGETVALGVYGSGLTDVTGVSILVSFDTLQVAFEEALETAQSGEASVLRSQAGAIALFLPARIRGGTQAEFGGAILSPTSTTVAGAAGLLGELRFTALAGYSGATLTLDQVIFNSLGGVQDTIETAPTALLTPPLDLFSGQKGLFSFDFDPGSGELFHQGQVAAGEEINVQIYVNDVSNLVNYSFKLSFDPAQLNYVTWSGQNFLATGGGTAIELDPLVTENRSDVGGAVLGPSAAQGVSGSYLVGTFTFTATETFSETDLVIVEYSTKAFGDEQVKVESSIFARLSTEVLSSGVATNSDFDGDGQIGFGDFFLFADAFGASTPDLRYDLDGDSQIGFGDFFLFADAFGGPVGRLVVGETPSAARGRLELEAVSVEEGLRIDLSARDMRLRSYAAVVEYDPAAFVLREVTDVNSALVTDGAPGLLLEERSEGQVLVLASRTGRLPAVEGVLATLYFEPLYEDAVGIFRVREALVRDGAGALSRVVELGAIEARQIPRVFALDANYPNPFNPETTIGYRLPVDTEMRLDIYDILGQQVRTLVDGVRPAGHHRVVWDGRNGAGHQVAGGVYFYRLQAEGAVRVRKLLLLK